MSNVQAQVQVSVPDEIDSFDEERLIAYFEPLIRTTLTTCIDREVWEFDERAAIYNIDLLRVEIDKDEIEVFYEVFFDAYYGCSSMNYADSDERSIVGRRFENYWVFEEPVPHPRRSSVDEF